MNAADTHRANAVKWVSNNIKNFDASRWFTEHLDSPITKAHGMINLANRKIDELKSTGRDNVLPRYQRYGGQGKSQKMQFWENVLMEARRLHEKAIDEMRKAS